MDVVSPDRLAALRTVRPRSLQILTQRLVERRPAAECAAFYGVTEAAFERMLVRALVDLSGISPGAAVHPPLEDAEELRCAQAVSAALLGEGPAPGGSGATADALAALARALWNRGPELARFATPPVEASPSLWRSTLRVVVVLLAIGALVLLSRYLDARPGSQPTISR